MIKSEIEIPEEYIDISPYKDSDFQQMACKLVAEDGFKRAIAYAMKGVDFDAFAKQLCSITTKNDFQKLMMLPFLAGIESKTSTGITTTGLENIDKEQPYTFMSNHRDIVLDASFLNITLIRNNIESCEVAIGNNLLIYDWIDILVKLNKSFVVRRNLGMRQALEAAKQLSGYIHFALTQKQVPIWIAQREGRTKDSNDRTQESLIKMLAIGGKGNIVESVKELMIAPVSISYEFDPNDYLKAKEFLCKKRDANFKKSQEDDLFSMQTGIFGYKGAINFGFTPCINAELDKLDTTKDKGELVKDICAIIDSSIHAAYTIYPCNYIAYDRLNGGDRFASMYGAEDIAAFDKYILGEFAKIDLEMSDDEKLFIDNRMLTMYANPLANKLKATGAI
ncbi:MAG: 1-acyl-sn-glycerol-3-phosphate acyltransferase [Bacteroidales bacterium]